jgi:chaperonin GroEL (HSP60 family)
VKIKRLGVITIVSCTSCTRVRTLYIFSRDSSKCSKCTRKRVVYDRNFSKADFDKFSEEKDRLEATRTHIIIKVASLDKRIKVL